MNYHKTVFLCGMAAVAVALSPPAQALLTARSVPPASFLEYHVDTVPQLAFEVKYDRVVRVRLAHHFHLSEPAMCVYVRDHLVLRRLTAPYRTRVYCISARGREYFVVTTLKKGSAVFALRRTGQPILRLVCGNPLVAALPPSLTKAAARPHPPVKRVKAAALERGAAPASPVAASPLAASAAPVAASVPVVTAAPGLSSGVIFTRTGASGGAGWLMWLPVVGGLTALLSHNRGVGGSGGPSASPLVPQEQQTPPIIITTPHAPAPAPEPSPALVFLIGLTALTAWRLVGRHG